MIHIAVWRREDEGYGAWVFFPGKEFWVSASGESTLIHAAEKTARKFLPDFIRLEFEYHWLGQQEDYIPAHTAKTLAGVPA